MKGLIILWVCLITSLNLPGQEKQKYNFNLLRQEDDHSGLSKINKPSFYQRVKYSPLLKSGNISYGGSYRGQIEFFSNEEFGRLENGTDAWYLQRFLAHTNFKFNSNWKIFGEIGSSRVFSKSFPSPVDEDVLYLNQAFVAYDSDNWNLQLGRRNLKIGSRRLVDPREGPNVRRSFDGLAVTYKLDHREIQGFYSSPIRPKSGALDNITDFSSEKFWGFYGSNFQTGTFKLDVYYMGTTKEENEYERGKAEELRHSIGIRQYKNTDKWSYDNEAIIQWGSFGENSILAWTASLNLWRKLGKKHQAGVKTELISGDDGSASLGTFNPLYPRGAYFGRVARFGPSNLIDLHPYWTFIHKKFSMEMDYVFFWRYSIEDAVYGPVLNIVLPDGSGKRFIAHQLGTIFTYQFSPFIMVELESNMIFRGNLLKDQIRESRDLLHTVFTLEIKI